VRTLALRLLACVALAGQLQWLPGAALCERHHQMAASHCEQHAAPSGRAVGPAQAPMADACPLAGPCSVPAPALPAGGPRAVTTVAVAAGDVAAVAAPPSFNPVPLSPPPQS
jgi:hypothetical protein